MMLAGLVGCSSSEETAWPPGPLETELPALRVEGRRIVDDQGRAVLLRGVNVNQLGDYFQARPDIPPAIPLTRSDVEKIAALGFNAIRLIVHWSAIEFTSDPVLQAIELTGTADLPAAPLEVWIPGEDLEVQVLAGVFPVQCAEQRDVDLVGHLAAVPPQGNISHASERSSAATSRVSIASSASAVASDASIASHSSWLRSPAWMAAHLTGIRDRGNQGFHLMSKLDQGGA